jgi:hypothetical protein
MVPITSDQFEAMFRPGVRAFHLELRDSYNVEQEEIPFEKWLEGVADDYQWRQEWLSFVRRVTRSGVKIHRVRVVTEPHTDYVCWEMALDPQNIEAGEEIRYLPRHQAVDISFPAEDCWLFDDHELVLSLFKPNGRSGGYAIEDAPDVVAAYRAVRDSVWPRAVPYGQYASE